MVLGNLIVVKIGTKKLVAQQKCDISIETEMLETTSKDSGAAKEFLPDKYSGTINISGLYDPYASTGTYETSNTLFTAQIGKTLCALKFGETAGGKYYFACNAYIQSHSVEAGTGDVATYSITFQITGAITMSQNAPD